MGTSTSYSFSTFTLSDSSVVHARICTASGMQKKVVRDAGVFVS